MSHAPWEEQCGGTVVEDAPVSSKLRPVPLLLLTLLLLSLPVLLLHFLQLREVTLKLLALSPLVRLPLRSCCLLTRRRGAPTSPSTL